MELVPSSPAATTFAQQGTVDWTALSTTTFSASLAILGRLSGAGLEPLTVAMAQAMCVNIPIGIRGEQRLMESMSSLKSFSSFGDVVWFGVGVRHVLRTLVQTSQGASSVALAAALAETHSTAYSAQIFYDLTKLMNSPAELTPAYSQWESYVRVCSGIFATSAFGQRVGQMTKLAGLMNPLNVPDTASNRVSEPQDLARVLCAVGQVQAGRLESIEMLGGLGCCWTTVFCDFILALRVQVRGTDGAVLFQNYDPKTRQAQVRVMFCVDSKGIYCSGRTFVLNPMSFVARWHTQGHSEESHLITSRLGQAGVVQECFGDLLRTIDVQGFAALLASCGLIYHGSPRCWRYTSPEGMIEGMTVVIPEMSGARDLAVIKVRMLKESILQREKLKCDEHVIAPSAPVQSGFIWHERAERKYYQWRNIGGNALEQNCFQMYVAAVRDLQKSCGCGHHPFRCSTIAACFTIIVLAYFLSELVFDDVLCLSRLGVRYLYDRIFERRIPSEDLGSVRAYLLVSARDQVQGSDLGTGFAEAFELYLRLFSGFAPDTSWAPAVKPKMSAMGHGGLYCYVDLLREPHQSCSEASRIHIGRGTINTAERTYPAVFDQDQDQLLSHGKHSQIPKFPRARALANENVTLRYWYEQWDEQEFEARHSANPMACLIMGWSGTQGAWLGHNTWTECEPLQYQKGFGPEIDQKLVAPTSPELPEQNDERDSSGEQLKSTRAPRRCRICKASDHDSRKCPQPKVPAAVAVRGRGAAREGSSKEQ